MKLNKKITEILKEFNINSGIGLTYLLSLHFNTESNFVTENFKQKIASTKIVENTDTGLKWNIGLFEGVETAFELVEKEYIPLFEKAGKDRFKRESLTRIKKLFAENPEIRKDEIIGATEMYLLNTDPKFVRFPHYFIEKGKGGDKTQDILGWIEKYRLTQENSITDNTRRLI